MQPFQLRESLENSIPAEGSIRVATLVYVDQMGTPSVAAHDKDGTGKAARSLIRLGPQHVGCQVALFYEDGDLDKPIIAGVIQTPSGVAPADLEAEIDGDSILLEGKRQIILRCGKASIVLTRDGKIVVRGSYLVSRSSGVNRIKGGSVQIN